MAVFDQNSQNCYSELAEHHRRILMVILCRLEKAIEQLEAQIEPSTVQPLLLTRLASLPDE